MDVGASSLGWSVERFKKCLQNLYFMFAIKEWLDVQDDALISGVQLFTKCVAGQCLISSVLSGKQDGILSPLLQRFHENVQFSINIYLHSFYSPVMN